MDIITELNHDFESGKNSIKWLENAMTSASIGFKLRLQHGLMLEAVEYLETYKKFLIRYEGLNDVFGDVSVKAKSRQAVLAQMQEQIKDATKAIRQSINIIPV